MKANVYKGNKLEVPPDMPEGLWLSKVREYHHDPATAELPFYDPIMEYLDPRRLAVVKAKARVWWEVTGRLPDSINHWWEIRAARRDETIPERRDVVLCEVSGDTLRCGECGATYSRGDDGEFGITHCNLCGVVMIWREERDT